MSDSWKKVGSYSRSSQYNFVRTTDATAGGTTFTNRIGTNPSVVYVNGDIDMSGSDAGPINRIINVADPIRPQDVATKYYVDTRSSGGGGGGTSAGSTGPVGPPGPKGDNGALGPPGPTGPPGSLGPAGPQGIPGENTGFTGPAGVPGPTGVAGPAGPQGDTGAQGPRGLQGATGLQGSQGYQGSSGIVLWLNSKGKSLTDNSIIDSFTLNTTPNNYGQYVTGIYTVSATFGNSLRTIPANLFWNKTTELSSLQTIPSGTWTLNIFASAINVTDVNQLGIRCAAYVIRGTNDQPQPNSVIQESSGNLADPTYFPPRSTYLPSHIKQIGLSSEVKGTFITSTSVMRYAVPFDVDFVDLTPTSDTEVVYLQIQVFLVNTLVNSTAASARLYYQTNFSTNSTYSYLQTTFGQVGAKGEQGLAGPTGNTGPAGIGIQGSTGSAGPAGPLGATGPTGSRGLAGPTGVTGPTGPGANGSPGMVQYMSATNGFAGSSAFSFNSLTSTLAVTDISATTLRTPLMLTNSSATSTARTFLGSGSVSDPILAVGSSSVLGASISQQSQIDTGYKLVLDANNTLKLVRYNGSTTAASNAMEFLSNGNVLIDRQGVNSATLYVDSINNRVGVGTGNPGYTLEVNGDLYCTGNLRIGGAGGGGSGSGGVVKFVPNTQILNMDSSPITGRYLQKKASILYTETSYLKTSNVSTKMSGVSIGAAQVYGLGVNTLANMPTNILLGTDGSGNVYYSNSNTAVPVWQLVCSGILDSVLSIGYNAGLWVAGGTGLYHNMMYSYDGKAWVGLGKPVFSTQCNYVGYAGGIWVAGGGVGANNPGDSLNTIASSTDGIIWYGCGITEIKGGAFTVAYSMINSQPTWVITGRSGNDSITGVDLAYSYDARTWNGVNIFTSWATGSIVYANGVFMITGSGGSSIAYSADGVYWTGYSTGTSGSIGSGGAYTIAFANGIWVAGGDGTAEQANSLAWSNNNGVTWNGLGNGVFSTQCNDVKFYNNIWVAVGDGSANTLAYSYDGKAWIGLGKSIFPDSGHAIQYVNGVWYATGGNTVNNAAYSYDGFNWYGLGLLGTGTSPTFRLAAANMLSVGSVPVNVNTFVNKIVFPANRIIAAGGAFGSSTAVPSGRLMYSDDDGATWNVCPGAINNAMFSDPVDVSNGVSAGIGGSGGANSVAWNGSVWVAVGHGTTHSIAYSDDGGLNWYGVSGKTIFSVEGRCVKWNGKYFVAVGRGTKYTTAYSQDGINWVGTGIGGVGGGSVFSYDIASSENSDISGGGNCVMWNGKKWIAGGSGLTYSMAYSSDGLNWNIIPGSNVFSTYAYGLVWCSARYVATGRGATNTLAWSADGDTWIGLGKTTFTTYGRGIAWNKSNCTWVAAGCGGNTLAYSREGIVWTGCGTNVFTPIRRFMAVGSGTANNVAYSDDGISWVGRGLSDAIGLNISGAPRTLHWTGRMWLIGGDVASNNAISFSYDGIRWQDVSGSGVVFNGGGCYDIIANSNTAVAAYTKYLAVGMGTYSVALSDDGFNWTPNLVATGLLSGANGAQSAVWLDGSYNRWVVGGKNGSDAGVILYSNDASGTSWGIATVFNSNHNINVLAWNGTHLVAGGNSTTNKLAWSSNGGVTWTASTNTSGGGNTSTIFSSGCNGAAWSPTLGRWVAVGGGGTSIAYSSTSSGASWTAASTNIFTTGNSVVWDISNARFVACGSNNGMAYSLDGITWTGVGNTTFSTGGTFIAVLPADYPSIPAGNTVIVDGFANRFIAGGTGATPLVYSQDGANWSQSVTAPAGRGVWIATGTGTNSLAYSSDGRNWRGITGTSVFGTQGNAVAYGNGLWVAGGSDSSGYTLAYSYDGLAWTRIQNVFTSACNGVVFGNNMWVAVGSGTNSFAYSYNGMNWTATSSASSVFTTQGLSVSYSGANKLFVATGQGGNTMAYSVDGKLWRAVVGSTSLFSSYCSAVAYNPAGTFWVAVGSGGNSFAYSSDGVTWSANSDATGVFTYGTDVAYGNGMWVATGTGAAYIAYSMDGKNWTGIPATWPFTGAGLSITFGNGLWVAGGNGGNSLAYSTDARKWMGVPLVGSGVFSTQANGVSMGYITQPYSSVTPVRSLGWTCSIGNADIMQPTIVLGQGSAHTATFSPDGTQWNGMGKLPFAGSAGKGRGIAWNGNMWIAVGKDAVSGASIAYSTDGLVWTQITGSEALFSIAGNGIAWNGTRFIAVGQGNNSILYSDDGLTWTPVVNSIALFGNGGYSVAWNGYRWVAVGAGAIHNIAYSIDNGVSWTGAKDVNGNATTTALLTVAGYSVCWGGSRWVVAGAGGNSIAYSVDVSSAAITAAAEDGAAWVGVSSSAALFPLGARGVSWNGKRFVCVGAGGVNAIAYSNDAKTWYSSVSGSGVSTWVAVGNGSVAKLAYSKDGKSWSAVSGSTALFDTSGASAAAWNGSNWVAIGGTKIAASSDGVSWSQTTTPSNNMTALNGITAIGTRFVSVGNSGGLVPDPSRCSIIYSDNNATTWSNATDSTFVFTKGNAVVSGNSKLVAGGGGNYTLANSSDNGATWSGVFGSVYSNSKAGLLDSSGITVVFNDTTKVWIVGGMGASYSLATSNNGTVWNPVSNSKSPSLFSTMVYGLAHDDYYNRAVACGFGTSFALAQSSDAYSTTWTGVAGSASLFSGGGAYDVTCVYGLGDYNSYSGVYWVAGGEDSNGGVIVYTTDKTGTTGWTTSTTGNLLSRVYGIGFSPTTQGWLAVGSGTNACVLYSNNGQNWTDSSNSKLVYTTAYHTYWTGSAWLVVGEGPYSIGYSTAANGATWAGVAGSTNILTSAYEAMTNGSRWIAVGSGSLFTMATTTDMTGVTGWTGIAGTKVGLFDIAANSVYWSSTGGPSGNGMWVVSGESSSAGISIAVSLDVAGTTWMGVKASNSLFSTQVNALTYSGTKWFAGGEGTNVLGYSVDNGTTWTTTYQKLVTVGDSSLGYSIAYSQDNGTTWTGATDASGFSTALTIFTTRGNAVAYNGTVYVAVGCGKNTLAYSYNGNTWTGLGTSVFAQEGRTVEWNGSYFLAGGGGGSITLARSTDGITWTQLLSRNCWTVAGGTKSIGSKIMASPDGVTQWTDASFVKMFSTGCYNVKWNGTAWVAVGRDVSNSILVSSDPTGLTGWRAPTSGTSMSVAGNSVEWNGAAWVAVGDGTSTSIVYTTEPTGLTGWTAASTTPNVPTSCTSVVWNGVAWVATGLNGANGAVWYTTSLYGSTGWTLGSITTVGAAITSIAWNGSAWVIGVDGTNTRMYYNTSAVPTTSSTWTPISSVFTTSCYSVSWNGHAWVALGNGLYKIMYNTNPVPSSGWVAATGAGIGSYLAAPCGVSWNGYAWVACGADTAVAYTTVLNGSSGWTAVSTAAGSSILSTGYGVGSAGVASPNPLNYYVNGLTWNGSANRWLVLGCGDYDLGGAWQSAVYLGDASGATFHGGGGQGLIPITITGIRAWDAVGMSASGQYQTAVVNGGQLYTSSNYGQSWTPRDVYGNLIQNVAVSGDGSKQTVIIQGGQIYVSQDYGATWASRNSNRAWSGVACATSDGIRQTAIVNGGQIYVCNDISGITWTDASAVPARAWSAIAMSSTGARQLAAVNGGQLYVSYNYWATDSSAVGVSGAWSCVAVAADGSRYLAAMNGGQIYYSSDPSGLSWTASNSPVANWQSLAMNSAGTKQYAAANGGYIYMSSDSGATWAPLLNAGVKNWNGLALSSDGSVFTAVTNNLTSNNDGYIYISSGLGTSMFSGSSGVAGSAGNKASWNSTKYVACGEGSMWVGGLNDGSGNATLSWSNNGINWTPQGNYVFTGGMTGVAYGVGTGTWVAVGKGNNTIATSTDGKMWYGQGGASVASNGVSYAKNSRLFLVAKNNGSVLYSSTGAKSSWSSGGTPFTTTANYVAQGYDTSGVIIYVAAGSTGGGDGNLKYSYDLASWSVCKSSDINYPDSTFINYGKAVAYGKDGSGNALWVAVGNSNGGPSIRYSYSGKIGWTETSTTVFTTYGADVVFANGVWVAAGAGNSVFAWSNDGRAWYSGMPAPSGGNIVGFSVAWNGYYFLGSLSNGVVYRSFDGKVWGAVSTALGTTAGVVLGSGGIINATNTLSSANGSNLYDWTGETSQSGELFVGVGSGTLPIIWSMDGKAWTGISGIFTVAGNGVAYGLDENKAGLWVAAGQGTNTLAWSASGKSWTPASSPFTTAGNGVAYNGATLWVSVGQGTNTIATSTTGKSWSGIGATIFTVAGTGVAYGRDASGVGVWVATGQGTNSLAFSYTGITWTGVVSGSANFSIKGNAAAFGKDGSGNDMWVAVGQGTNSIAWSYDGKTWTGIPQGTTTFTNYGSGVAYANGLWVATGSGTNSLAWSIDGKTWTGVASDNVTNFSGYGSAVTYANGMWVADGSGGNMTAWSLDGKTWTGIVGGGASLFSGRGIAAYFGNYAASITFPERCSDAVYSLNLATYVAVGTSNTNTIATSGNGSAWTGQGKLIMAQGNSVYYSSITNLFYAGGAPTTGQTSTLYYSTTGLVWYPYASLSTNAINVAVYGRLALSSTSIGSQVFLQRVNGVAWNGTRFVAVGQGQGMIAYSSDGLTWTPVANQSSFFTDASGGGSSVYYNGTQFVATGYGPHPVIYSADGITWTSATYNTGSTLVLFTSGAKASAYGASNIFTGSGNGVAWNSRRWLAVGEGSNTLALSDDGISWSAVPNTTNNLPVVAGYAVAGNPRVGIPVVDSQIVLMNDGNHYGNNSLQVDLVSDVAFNRGFDNVTVSFIV